MSAESCHTHATPPAGEECCHAHATPPAGEECCDFPEKLLELADEAWMEVLKEKIKKEIEASCGEKLDKLAKLVAETNKAKWAAHIAGKQHCQEYKQNLFKLFSSEE